MTRDSQGMGPERGGAGGGEVDFEGGLWWFRLFGEELYLGVGVSDGVGGNERWIFAEPLCAVLASLNGRGREELAKEIQDGLGTLMSVIPRLRELIDGEDLDEFPHEWSGKVMWPWDEVRGLLVSMAERSGWGNTTNGLESGGGEFRLAIDLSNGGSRPHVEILEGWRGIWVDYAMEHDLALGSWDKLPQQIGVGQDDGAEVSGVVSEGDDHLIQDEGCDGEVDKLGDFEDHPVGGEHFEVSKGLLYFAWKGDSRADLLEDFVRPIADFCGVERIDTENGFLYRIDDLIKLVWSVTPVITKENCLLLVSSGAGIDESIWVNGQDYLREVDLVELVYCLAKKGWLNAFGSTESVIVVMQKRRLADAKDE